MAGMNLGVKTDWDPHERSATPFLGYNLALCAYHPSDRPEGYVGYYKVYASSPRGYWEVEGLVKGSTRVHATPEQALREAEALGRHIIGNLPTRGWRNARPRSLLELRLVLSARQQAAA